MSTSYLLILGDRQAIAWVLREERMAFPEGKRSEVEQLTVGDELLIYTTRGAFRNPNRDRGRVISRAHVTSEVSDLEGAVEFGSRRYPRGCSIAVDSLAPWGDGVELQPLVPRLQAFPDPDTWSARLRRPLLQLSESDGTLLRERLQAVAGKPSEHLRGYLAQDRPMMTASRK